MPSDPNILVPLAQRIIEGQALQGIYFYIVLGALAIVVSAVFVLITAFFTERARQIAVSAAFNKTLEQLKESTEETEKIRTRIAHDDWTNKEIKTLRRNKLEELLAALYNLLYSIDSDTSMDAMRADNFDISAKEHVATVRQLANLYFPELNDHVKTLHACYRQFYLWRLQVKAEVRREIIETDTLSKKAQLMLKSTPLDNKAFQSLLDEQKTVHDRHIAIESAYVDECYSRRDPLDTAVTLLAVEVCGIMHDLMRRPEPVRPVIQ